jgi:indolepyruvate ferredoxin oxidoreductase
VRHGRTRILANTHEVPVAESLRNPDASLKVPELLEKLRFAAGSDRVETLDAQTLAQDFLGDSIVSNMLVLGHAWQRGLVPVGLPALLRALELNGVAVDSNKLAFALGRLTAADPSACDDLLGEHGASETHADESIDDIVARGVAHLTAYQNAAYARRYAGAVQRARKREASLPGGDETLPFTHAVALSLLKLMAYKDEYEVARLYTDGAFQQRLQQQFEGDYRLEFYMAPPLLSRARDGRPPRKLRLGPWMRPAMKLLARARRLRGTALDLFGRTEERRMERALIDAYQARIDELLPRLEPANVTLATEIALVPLQMRGYGHVKIANVALARTREAELLHRLDPERHPRPAPSRQAGQLKGIPIATAH